MTASPACDWHHPHLPCPAFAWVEHGRANQPCRVSALWPPRSQSPGGVCLPEVLAAEMDDLRDSMAALLWRLLPREAGADWHTALDVNSRHYAPAGTTGQGRFRGRVGTPLAPASRLISLSSLVRLVETGRGLPGSNDGRARPPARASSTSNGLPHYALRTRRRGRSGPRSTLMLPKLTRAVAQLILDNGYRVSGASPGEINRCVTTARPRPRMPIRSADTRAWSKSRRPSGDGRSSVPRSCWAIARNARASIRSHSAMASRRRRS